MSQTNQTRAAAACAVAAVFAGANLDDALSRHGFGLPPTELPLLRALAYGVLRDYTQLTRLAALMLTKPMRDEPELLALLACGLYQLRAMRIPPHAAVAETVEAVTVLGKPWAKGLTNALLRRYQRERETLDAQLPPDPAVRLSYPEWLLARIKADWPGAWRGVLAAGNVQAPLTLRVNRRHGNREAYLAELAGAGIAAEPVVAAPDAVRLVEALPVEQIPGFGEGRVSVQDASAQLVVELLDLAPGLRVLDACAAPGGKTAHLLEREPTLAVTALDNQPARVVRLRDTLDRLGLQAKVLEADAAKPSLWADPEGYDRILLDAPCSGTGVIRRHPDIKWLRRETDIAAAAELQQRLLRALWPLLRPGGVLVYATCSILKAEGEDVVNRFLADHSNAAALPITVDGDAWGEATGIGRRIAPGDDFDGFYFARLSKR